MIQWELTLARGANKRHQNSLCLRCGLAILIAFQLAAEPPHVATTPHRSPADERASFKVPDGFEVQLVASEPDINKPINIAFDAKGRLWVTSTTEYPYPAKDRPGQDTVKVLSDFGPDGRARKVETFADGLNIPIGILPYKDGAIVYSIPNLWFLRDTDGDLKCDKREVLYSGFGHKDTHGMVNGLFMGFDGWVYACHGYMNDSVVKGTDGHEIKMNSGNIFRFKPDGSRVELFSQGQVNPFGSCMDKWGNLYTACCHSKPITLVLRGAVYESFTKPHDGLGFGPAMVHQYRGSTALCGLAWYDADYFPNEYQESFYLGDVVNNCVNRFTVTWKGATPTAHQQADFLTSTDPWFRPCDIKLGPDGALYVADFYNRIIGHYEVPLDHPGRDRTSGRIWRIVRKDKPVEKVSDRTKATVEELVKDLGSGNIAVRFAALHQLAGKHDIGSDVLTSAFQKSSPISKTSLLWAMERAGRLDALADIVRELRQVIRYRSDENTLLQVHAVRVILESGVIAEVDDYSLLETGNPRVRQAVAELLARLAVDRAVNSERSADLLIARFPISASDPGLQHSFRIALRNIVEKHSTIAEINRQDPGRRVLAEVALGISSPRGAELIMYLTKSGPGLDITPDMIRHAIRFANCEEDQIQSFLNKLQIRHPFSPTKQLPFVRAVTDGFSLRGQPIPKQTHPWIIEVAMAALSNSNLEVVLQGLEIAKSIDSNEMLEKVAHLAVNQKQPIEIRAAALKVIAQTHRSLVGRILSDANESLALREAAAKALASVNKPEARDALVAALASAPGKLASAIAMGLAGTKHSGGQLCDAVEQGKASPRLLADRAVRQKLESHGLKERVDKLTQGLPPIDKQIEELINKRRSGFQKEKHDVAIGKELFTKHCAICHQVADQGTKIGPQLDGIGIRGLDRLLEDVLDPNRNVDPLFRSTTVNLSDGRSLSGLFLREDGNMLIFADNQGKEFTVRKDQVELRHTSSLSAMPANVVETLSDTDFAALLAYLLTLKK